MELKKRITDVLKVYEKFLLTEELQPTRVFIQRFFQRLEQPMQVAFIGAISSAKSTLVNAIMGKEELVKTGVEEVTYNVSWLKYGDNYSNIKIVFKDGHEETVDRNNWNNWANRKGSDNIKNTIRYIEVPYYDEILKEINIIDTPGLLSAHGIDSQNTIDFLSRVKPDAIVVLIPHGLNKEVAEQIQSYQGETGINITPLNTLGVLSRIDSKYNALEHPVMRPLEKGLDTCSRLKKDAATATLFYNIYPLNALMALASSTIEEKDEIELKKLAKVDKQDIIKRLKQISDDEREGITLPDELLEIKRLRDKLSENGLFLLHEKLQSEVDLTLDDLRAILNEMSGFKVLNRVIRQHFGNRAALIKLHTALTDLLQELKKQNNNPLPNQLHEELQNILCEEQDYKIFELLTDYYEGKLEDMIQEEDDREEILHITGEYGESYLQRLNLSSAVDEKVLEEYVKGKKKKWHGRKIDYNFMARPDYIKHAETIITSYSLLQKRIIEVKTQIEDLNNLIK